MYRFIPRKNSIYISLYVSMEKIIYRILFLQKMQVDVKMKLVRKKHDGHAPNVRCIYVWHQKKIVSHSIILKAKSSWYLSYNPAVWLFLWIKFNIKLLMIFLRFTISINNTKYHIRSQKNMKNKLIKFAWIWVVPPWCPQVWTLCYSIRAWLFFLFFTEYIWG